MSDASGIFCYAPWSNLEILPSGDILPCCKFQQNTNTYNIKFHSVDDYKNSASLAEIKSDFLAGQWPTGCERCRLEEQSGIPSKRQLDYERWHKHYDTYDLSSQKLLTVSMALGNVCNLKCIICNPYSSSKWQKEYRDIYKISVDNIEHIRNGIIENITQYAQDLRHIDFHGGEPFLSNLDRHRELLDHFTNKGLSQNITLHYTTNGTIWPEPEWFERWRHFAEVEVQISIDGVGGRFEYLRFPADWHQVSTNLQAFRQHEAQHSNFRISISHTVSAYNVFYLDEFFTWCYNETLPKPWTGKLHKPQMLRPTVWPEAAKKVIADHLLDSAWPEVRAWANMIKQVDDSEWFSAFVERTAVHDRYRGLDFQTTFPELAPYL